MGAGHRISLRTAALISTLLALGGCAVVNDFGGYRFDGGLASTVDGALSDFGLDARIDDSGIDFGAMDSSAEAGIADMGSDGGRSDLGADGGSIDLGPGSDLSTVSPLLGKIVISEFAFGGPTSGTDEFVEIYNRSSEVLDIGGLVLAYQNASGVPGYSARATIPIGTVLQAHGFFLMGSVGYVGTISPDIPRAWSTGFAGSGGHLRISIDGLVLDTVGWNVASFPEETSVIGPSPDSNRSFERKARTDSTATSMSVGGADATGGNGVDTDDNGSDFLVREARQPQSSSSPIEVP